MIESGFTYLAVLLFLAAVIVQLDRRFPRFFNYVPGIVVLYFAVMTFSTIGLWKFTDDVNLYHNQLRTNLLPVMIFLMLLRCDLRKIVKLGPRMLLGFFAATLTICIGFIVTFYLLRGSFQPHTWKTFAALCGSWIGGTGNMTAIQLALEVQPGQMSYTLLMDSVNYAVWVMVLLLAVPFARQFNHWTGADTKQIDEIGEQLAREQTDTPVTMDFHHLILLLGTAFFVAALAQIAGSWLPTNDFFTKTTWTVLIVTLAGVIGAMTGLGRQPGIPMLANLLLYLIVALIGSKADFTELAQAPLYIFAGFLILGIHAILLGLIAKVFRLDLFTCGVASLANVGGVASAPILAAAYNEVLVPVGVLMALLGLVVGTGAGLMVGKVLAMIPVG
jgi:uncharacterized membrane protein